MVPEPPPGFRIGELSRRTGVSAQLLRTWEHRYGLLRPARSPGGYRLYTEADERRVRHMRACLARGLSAAEAARAALRDDGTLPIPAISSSHARPTEPRTWPPAWMPSTRQPLRRSWTGCWPTSPSSPS
jgi:DNA-binding transcriptional MerR regulator